MSKPEKPAPRRVSATDSTGGKQTPPQLRSYLFKPGQSGNPSGRPKGSRNALSEAFIAALHADFAEHGVNVIEKVRDEKPADYLKMIASILPKDINLNAPGLEDMDDDEILEALEQVRTVLGLLTAKPAKKH